MPGNRYVQVLNTYLTRRLLMAVMLGTLVICLIQILAWWFVGNAGAVDRTQAMFICSVSFWLFRRCSSGLM